MKRRFFLGTAAVFLAGIVILSVLTVRESAVLPPSFHQLTADVQKTQFFDRNGEPLNISYQNYWNIQEQLPLHNIPELLQKMFVFAEDKNFYSHKGVDWKARLNALRQNMQSGKIVRGASTLSEQTVRMIYPRPRTFFSKWVEGLDAIRLERRFSKADILEFYLNQVPYASNRRGVLQASKYYFSKTPDRLSVREMAALVVLVRAPTSFDLYRYPERIDRIVAGQLEKFKNTGIISEKEYRQAKESRLRLTPRVLSVSAGDFLEYIRRNESLDGSAVKTTLDSYLQTKIQKLTWSRLKDLRHRGVNNAAVLVLDRRTGSVLAWVSESLSGENKAYDAVQVLRQPASAQKPLLYGLALSKGWTAATIIKDAPFSSAVGRGIHHFHNYSNLYYGNVTLREALGNSLNIPAVKTIGFVGVENYLEFLKKSGFSHLNKEAAFYREGLALGNAEVSLLELTRGYLMLANMGMYKPVRVLAGKSGGDSVRMLPETSASLIGHILSDPLARQLEFGRDSILNFPVQTAVKTGTSTDYRDSWAMGYNSDYVAGIWMGNLTYEPMEDVTGSVGPALLLRSVFSELNRLSETKPLFLSPLLTRRKVNGISELFDSTVPETVSAEKEEITLVKPENGIDLAVDPRVPREYQAYLFELNFLPEGGRVIWIINEENKPESEKPSFLWPLERGKHTVSALVSLPDGSEIRTQTNTIYVH